MREQNRMGFYSFGFIFVFASFSIGNWIERYQSGALLMAFVSSFICYLFLLQEQKSDRLLFVFGLLARLVLFFSLPSLSDDVYRFIWDGLLLKNGIHPFSALPESYLAQEIPGLDKELFKKLNSPNYFTIYPPFNQAIFWLSVNLSTSWLASVNIMRSILSAADIGSFLLLRKTLEHYKKDRHLAFWYFLNPLVVVELTGNLHFEGLVVFFLLIGALAFEKQRNWLSVSGFGLAIGTKLLPLIYLPSLFFYGLEMKRWWIALASAILGAITILPMLNETLITGMASSLELYFRKFEFNASLYFIAREIGFLIYGYNNIAKIGPLLSVLSLLSILGVSAVASVKKWNLFKSFLFILTIYLFFATIIHPWYIIPLIAFGILSRYRFPILWSFLIFLTYLGYTTHGFELPLWIVFLEYLSVSTFAVAELVKFKHL
ncbi:MAG: hypothetical protein AAGI25_08115 [Bacteroidota bacterium]